MRTKERIRTIRLLEKLKENPAYAESIGIEVKREPVGTDLKIKKGRCA